MSHPTEPQQKTKSSPQLVKAMSASAGKLALFVVVSIIVLLLVRAITEPKIQQAERANLLATFNQVLPASLYDNDPLQDQFHLQTPNLLQKLGAKDWVTIYRARNQQQPVGVIFETIAPNGYSGNIYILVGVLASGEISGVRVLKHAETPGLGDKIEINKNDWVLSFNGKILNSQNLKTWAVKKDGGEFDQFTGATITPRAVVEAVENALEVVNELGDKIYE